MNHDERRSADGKISEARGRELLVAGLRSKRKQD